MGDRVAGRSQARWPGLTAPAMITAWRWKERRTCCWRPDRRPERPSLEITTERSIPTTPRDVTHEQPGAGLDFGPRRGLRPTIPFLLNGRSPERPVRGRYARTLHSFWNPPA